MTHDGGYAYVAVEDDYSLTTHTLDSAGNVEWVESYGGCGKEIVLQGQTDTWGTPIDDKHMPLTNASGSLRDFANCIIQTNDGGFALAGSTQWTWLSTYNLIWLVKTDSARAAEWNQTYANFESLPVYALKVRWAQIHSSKQKTARF